MAYLLENKHPGTFVAYTYHSEPNKLRVRKVIKKLEDWLSTYPSWRDVPQDIIKRIFETKETKEIT